MKLTFESIGIEEQKLIGGKRKSETSARNINVAAFGVNPFGHINFVMLAHYFILLSISGNVDSFVIYINIEYLSFCVPIENDR